MIVNIPYHDNYLITKDGKVYRDIDNEIVELPISKRKYKTVKIDNVIFRLDYLILLSFIGPVDLPISYKDGDVNYCEYDNLKFDIYREEIVDDFLFLNNTSIILKRIPGSNYDYITNNGVVYSMQLHRFKGIMHRKNGYHAHNVMICNKSKKWYTHRLVYLTWIGELDSDMVIDHLNGKIWDNRVSNLELTTSAENNLRAYNMNLKSKTWTDCKLEIVCMMMDAGFMKDDICRVLKLTDSDERRHLSTLINHLKNNEYMSDIAKKYNLQDYDNSDYRYRIISDEMENVIKELVFRGYQSTEISKITGLNRSTILTFIRNRMKESTTTIES